ncbi:MAG: SpoIIE family protein phosphatase [Anaerolineae bacterium]|nr:SpoIIE family protein phosphatase [Anaerolineae bacterium]
MSDAPTQSPAPDDFTSILRNVSTDSRKLENELTRLGQALRAKYNMKLSDALNDMVWNIHSGVEQALSQGREALTRLEQLQDLVRTSALISTSLDLENVLGRVLDTVITLTQAERAYLMLRDHETGKLDIWAARNWDHESLSDAEVFFSRSIVEEAFTRREPIVTTNAQQDERFQGAVSIVKHGLRAVLCIPLTLQTDVVGVLYADNRITQGSFSVSSLPLLAAFGTQAAIAIEKARLHEEELARQKLREELAVGRRIQLSMLPRTTPSIPGWGFSAAYQAAREVGGDFYDFFRLTEDPNTLCIVIADVSDKGVPAALFMAVSRTMIRTSSSGLQSPAQVLQLANLLISQDTSADMFLTAFFAMLDTTNGRLVYANAGHNRPLWWNAASGVLHELRGKGMILGMFEEVKLEEVQIEVQVGDVIVFYTDGVTDAMNEAGDSFGELRLRKIMIDNVGSSAEEIQQAIMASLEEFVGDAAQVDDVTLVVAKWG